MGAHELLPFSIDRILRFFLLSQGHLAHLLSRSELTFEHKLRFVFNLGLRSYQLNSFHDKLLFTVCVGDQLQRNQVILRFEFVQETLGLDFSALLCLRHLLYSTVIVVQNETILIYFDNF